MFGPYGRGCRLVRNNRPTRQVRAGCDQLGAGASRVQTRRQECLGRNSRRGTGLHEFQHQQSPRSCTRAYLVAARPGLCSCPCGLPGCTIPSPTPLCHTVCHGGRQHCNSGSAPDPASSRLTLLKRTPALPPRFTCYPQACPGWTSPTPTASTTPRPSRRSSSPSRSPASSSSLPYCTAW